MNAIGPELSKEDLPKVEKKEITKDIADVKVSLDDLKKNILQSTSSKEELAPAKVIEKKAVLKKEVADEVFADQVNENALEYAVSNTEKDQSSHQESVTETAQIQTSSKNVSVLSKKYDQQFQSISAWVASSDRSAKQEIAASATTLLKDLSQKESNPLVEWIRKVTEWFFV